MKEHLEQAALLSMMLALDAALLLEENRNNPGTVNDIFRKANEINKLAKKFETIQGHLPPSQKRKLDTKIKELSRICQETAAHMDRRGNNYEKKLWSDIRRTSQSISEKIH